MYVSEKYRFVYLAVPRTGSMSLRKTLMVEYEAQTTGSHHSISSDPLDYKGKFIFAVVRSPYSRAYSLWKKVSGKKDWCKSMPFIEFTDAILRQRTEDVGVSQDEFLSRCPVPIHLFRFENIPDCFRDLPFYDSRFVLEHLNRQQCDPMEWVDHCCDTARKNIREWAGDEFQKYGYVE